MFTALVTAFYSALLAEHFSFLFTNVIPMVFPFWQQVSSGPRRTAKCSNLGFFRFNKLNGKLLVVWGLFYPNKRNIKTWFLILYETLFDGLLI